MKDSPKMTPFMYLHYLLWGTLTLELPFTCADSLGVPKPHSPMQLSQLDNPKPSHPACPIPPLEKPQHRLCPHFSLTYHLLANPELLHRALQLGLLFPGSCECEYCHFTMVTPASVCLTIVDENTIQVHFQMWHLKDCFLQVPRTSESLHGSCPLSRRNHREGAHVSHFPVDCLALLDQVILGRIQIFHYPYPVSIHPLTFVLE